METKEILFISHEVSRTGAPISLLNFLKWLKNNSNISFYILLRKDGELRSEFEAIAPTSIFLPDMKFVTHGLLGKICYRLCIDKLLLYFHRRRIVRKMLRANIGLIYSNTIANGDVLKYLSIINCPVISHVRELEATIRLNNPESFEAVKKFSKYYIAVSNSVKDNLVKNHGIPENKIERIHGFIPTRLYDIEDTLRRRALIRGELSIPRDVFIVCSSGRVGWQKGTDLFVYLANSIQTRFPKNKIYFVWVGGEKQGCYHDQLVYDINKLGLSKSVFFVGNQPNAVAYYSVCDVFAILSREDAFPRVCLEAANLGKPIVSFADSGGAAEFIENDGGIIVPYLDIDAMADKINELYNSPTLCQSLGQRAKNKVRTRYDIEVQAPKVLSVIKKLM